MKSVDCKKGKNSLSKCDQCMWDNKNDENVNKIDLNRDSGKTEWNKNEIRLEEQDKNTKQE